MINLSSYLARIDYSGATSPSVETLRAVHRAHLLTVPFENLDVALGRKIVIDEGAFVCKIVDQRRGGFCYELNGAFAALLRALGFHVTLLSARAARQGGGEGAEFDHLTLRVDLSSDQGDRWLADVGFGELFLEPLRIEPDREQLDPAGTFRLVRLGERLQLEKATEEGRWRRQYSFTLQPRRLEDFADMCHYQQTSPDSHFTQNSICSRATPDGRITLSGMKFIVTRNGRREERILGSERERSDLLREHFAILL
jgi:N-hydroxyarylamine O-acetyltransferase